MQDRHHIRGISEPLPEGETHLWEGAPAANGLIRRVLHVRLVVGYFGVLAVVALVSALTTGGGELLARLTWLALLGGAVAGMGWLYAGMLARNSRYHITSERILIQKGVAFPSVVNIPFRRIRGILLLETGGGAGDIALELVEGARLGYTFLWPHARPWHVRHPQPSLRCLPDVQEAAQVLQEAYGAFLERDRPTPQTGPTDYRVLDDDDTEVLHTRRPRGGASAVAGLLVAAALGACGDVPEEGPDPDTPGPAAVEALAALEFELGAGDTMRILDAETRSVLRAFPPMEGGMVRGLVPTLAQERRVRRTPGGSPYLLARSASGEPVLLDPETEIQVDIAAFGPDAVALFTQLVDAVSEGGTP